MKFASPYFLYSTPDDFDFFPSERCTKNQFLTRETNSDLTVTQTCSLIHPNRLTQTSLNCDTTPTIS